MIKTNLLENAAKTGIVLNAALLLTLAGCGRGSDAPNPAVQAQPAPVSQAPSPAAAPMPPPAVVEQAPAPVVMDQTPSPAVLEPDDYVYYPNYGIYYGSNRRQYAYMHANTWVSEPAPPGVSLDDLRASPSVKMDFHDAPANHHAAIAVQYPKNWKPSDAR